MLLSSFVYLGNQGGAGGAIAASSECNISISETKFQQNTAQFAGCLYLSTNANVTVENSAFVNNRASMSGGVFSMVNSCKLLLSYCTLSSNLLILIPNVVSI